MAEKKKRHGCLIFFLLILLVMAGGGFFVWNALFNWQPNAEAQKIINGPVDTLASQMLTQELTTVAGPGIAAAVVQMPSGSGSGVMLVIDTAQGFVPAPGVEGKRKQAMDAIGKIIAANQQNGLGATTVGLTYQEGGKNIISLASPMANLEALASGSLSETEFAAKMGLEINDLLYFKDLIGN